MSLSRRELLGLAPLILLKPPKLETFGRRAVPQDGDEAILAAIRPVHEMAKVPGLIAGILVPGREPRIASVGVRKVGSAAGFGAGDVIHLGSCTKAMTATMIGTLVEQGALSWTSTLGDIFPDQEMHPDVRTIALAW